MNKQVEQIKAKIERLKKWCEEHTTESYSCYFDAFNDIDTFINSLEEEPVSEDLEKLEKRGYVERVKMIEHTKICKLDDAGYPVHLTDLDGLIPNVFVGMQMQVKSTKYKVKEILAVVDKNFCRQIIQVEEL